MQPMTPDTSGGEATGSGSDTMLNSEDEYNGEFS